VVKINTAPAFMEYRLIERQTNKQSPNGEIIAFSQGLAGPWD
jgi:hypothetical protein